MRHTPSKPQISGAFRIVICKRDDTSKFLLSLSNRQSNDYTLYAANLIFGKWVVLKFSLKGPFGHPCLI